MWVILGWLVGFVSVLEWFLIKFYDGIWYVFGVVWWKKFLRKFKNVVVLVLWNEDVKFWIVVLICVLSVIWLFWLFIVFSYVKFRIFMVVVCDGVIFVSGLMFLRLMKIDVLVCELISIWRSWRRSLVFFGDL